MTLATSPNITLEIAINGNTPCSRIIYLPKVTPITTETQLADIACLAVIGTTLALQCISVWEESIRTVSMTQIITLHKEVFNTA